MSSRNCGPHFRAQLSGRWTWDPSHSQHFRSDRHFAAMERLFGRAHCKISETAERFRGITDAGPSGRGSGIDTLC